MGAMCSLGPAKYDPRMPEPYRSIADMDGSIGEVAADHFLTAFHTFIDHPSVTTGPGFFRYITGEMHPLGNCALFDDTVTAGTAATVIAPLAEAPLPTAVVATRPLGTDVDAALVAQGFAFAGAMPAMAVDISALAETALPDGYAFKEYDAVQSEDYVDAFAAGYELPRQLAALFSPAVAERHGNVRVYGIEKDGQIVSTSIVIYADGVAGVYCVSTLPEERKKGLGAYVTAEGLRLAQGKGYGVGVLQSSEHGYPVYQRLGFQDVGGLPLYIRMPG